MASDRPWSADSGEEGVIGMSENTMEGKPCEGNRVLSIVSERCTTNQEQKGHGGKPEVCGNRHQLWVNDRTMWDRKKENGIEENKEEG